jgi:HlyD family type I secretion membrane fusion protein
MNTSTPDEPQNETKKVTAQPVENTQQKGEAQTIKINMSGAGSSSPSPGPFVPSQQQATHIQFASVRTIVLIGLGIIGVGFFGLFGWMAFAPLAEGVVAPGRIAIDTNRKTVQHLEGGIVDKILVRDGDKVKKNDILITLDNKQIRARLNALEVRYYSAIAKDARLKSEIAGAKTISFPEALLAKKDEVRIKEIIDTQNAVFQSRHDTIEGRTKIHNNKIKELKERILGLEAEQKSNQEVKAVVQSQLEDFEKLLEKGLIEKPQVLDLKRRLSEINGAEGRIASSIAAAKINIGESKLEILQLVNNLKQDSTREFRETNNSIFEVEEQLASAQDIRDRIEIRAPRAGVIVGLKVHTRGGVIPPGNPILDIVPESDRLVIEAQVKPTDIDNITPGMSVRVQLTAFQSRSTPTLTGTLERVTADALEDPNEKIPFYLARVGVSEEELSRLDEGLFLIPGMPAEILIESGERTVLDYLLAPITQVLSRGFKEK